MTRVTDILQKIAKGDQVAVDELLPLVYDELRKLANNKVKCEKPGQLMDTTALVHEAYLRMTRGFEPFDWQSRRHFYCAAARAMERILIEQARRRKRLRRGGDLERVDFALIEEQVAKRNWQHSLDISSLSDALTELSNQHPVIAEVVRLRYYVGLTIEETAELCGISIRTANRHWAYAKAWLFERL